MQLGWDFEATFGKDISTSPPGSARWTAVVTGNYNMAYQDTLVGRTAPDLAVVSFTAGYRVPKEFGNTNRRLESAGPCGGSRTMVAGIDVGASPDDETVFTCAIDEPGSWISSGDNEEIHVDEAVAALGPQSPGAFVAQMKWGGHIGTGCWVVLPADPTRPAYEGGPTGPSNQCDIAETAADNAAPQPDSGGFEEDDATITGDGVPEGPLNDPADFGINRPTGPVVGILFDEFTRLGVPARQANCALESVPGGIDTVDIGSVLAGDDAAAQPILQGALDCGINQATVDALLVSIRGG